VGVVMSRWILVVDDSATVRMSLGRCLRDEGYTVVEAEDAAAGFARVAEHRPDLILLDLMMPGMNGPQFLRSLRENPAYSDVPVIVITGVRGLTIHPASLGVSEVVEKPFDADELLNKIALALYRVPSRPLDAPVVPARSWSDVPVPSDKPVVLAVDHNHSEVCLRQLDDCLSTHGRALVALTRVTPQVRRLARALRPSAIVLDRIEAEEEPIVEAMRADTELTDSTIIVLARPQTPWPYQHGNRWVSGPIDAELLHCLDQLG